MHGLTSRLGLSIGLVLALSNAQARLAAQQPAGKEVHKKGLRSVCLVKSSTGLGTGWVADAFDRFVVTNQHLVGSDQHVEVVFPVHRGELIADANYYLTSAPRLRARVLDVNPSNNLALIQLTTLPPGHEELKLASVSPGPGDRVHSIGNLGTSDPLWLYATGTVRSVYRKRWTVQRAGQACALDTRVIETQAPANLGDSGGPLLNDAGELVGVTLGGDPSEKTVSRFIDAGQVRVFLQATRWMALPLNAEEFHTRACRQLERGCARAAVTDFGQAIRRNPKWAWAHCNRAIAHRLAGQPAEARADADQAIQLAPKMQRAYFERGFAHDLLNKGDAAVADYSRALELDSKDYYARNNRGAVHMRAGRTQEALEDFSEAIRLKPDDALAYGNRANVLIRLKEDRRAIADFTRVLGLGGDAVRFQVARAAAYTRLEQYDLALKDLDVVRALAPKNETVWLETGVALHNKGDREEALKAYDRAIALKPSYALAYLNRGSLYEGMRKPAEAHLNYEVAVQLEPAYAKQVPLQDECYLRIINKSSKAVQVYLRCESKTKAGGWHWWYSEAGKNPGMWVVGAGRSADLHDKSWRVKARRVHLWAETLDRTGNWRLQERNQDIWLAERPYRARQPLVFYYTLNP
jgi:tetratricopeptide (TPR) repeat protein